MHNPELLASVARSYIVQQGIIPEEELRLFLTGMQPAFGASDAEVDTIIRQISADELVRVDEGLAITAARQAPWVNDRRLSITWSRAQAYHQMLREEGRPAKVLATLDSDTDEILNLCGNPADETPWSRRGLVLGDVQAGKTGTYLSLMNKAADAGYRLFIVLGGHTEKLRSQTQERIDEGFIGRQGASIRDGRRAGLPIGIGRINTKISQFQSLTTEQFDFGKKALQQFNLSLDAGLYVIVIKKNKRIFEALTAWLKEQGAAADHKLQLPLMLLDDESDYASVNTKDPDKDPTAINDAIRKMLGLFARSSYVAFTATPFANIFIDHTVEDDLFPKDFIYSLNTPTNYVGAEKVFGGADEEHPPSVQLIEDAEEPEHFPLRHKAQHTVELLPESCLESIRTFFVFNALRDLQPGGSRAPRSMLINVSAFMHVQGQVHALVLDYVEQLKAAIILHGGSDSWARSALLRDLAATFEKQYSQSVACAWEEVLATLQTSIQGLRVALLNSKTPKTDTTLSDADRLVVVGGNVLSRGLTLKGLAVSYFYRAPRASDTLLQMGRWFGYRDGYEDLCRVWIEAGVAHDFKQVQSSVSELRESFAEMRDQGRTPSEFGLAVRRHPEALTVTAANKMRSTSVTARRVSLLGVRCEATRLDASVDPRENNWVAFTKLLGVLQDHQSSKLGNHTRWREVGHEVVAFFFEHYWTHPSDTKFHQSALPPFIRQLAMKPQRARAGREEGAWDATSWDIIVVNGEAEPLDVAGATIRPARRQVTFSRDEPHSVLVSGTSARLAGRSDIRLAFDPDDFKRHTKSLGGGNPSEIGYYSKLARPVLMIYPLMVKFKGSTPSDFVELDIPFIAAKYALPTTEETSPGSDVLYYLNTVAQENIWVEYGLDDEDWEDIDDD